MKKLRPWFPWLLSVALCAGAAYSGPTLVGGGCSDCVLKAGDTMTGNLNMSEAAVVINPSGEVAIAITGGLGGINGINWNSSSVASAAQPTTYYNTGTQQLVFNIGSGTGFSQSSGANAIALLTNGSRLDFGAGASDYASSDGTTITFATSVAATGLLTNGGTGSGLNLASIDPYVYGSLATSNVNIGTAVTSGNTDATVLGSAVNVHPDNALDATDWVFSVGNAAGASGLFAVTYAGNGILSGYLASTTPHTMFSTYVNNTIQAFTYGGGVAPAFDFQVSAVRFAIRTAGSGGSSNATIRISDGTTNCDCTFACNTAAGNVRAACGTDSNCDFEASDSMTVSVSGVGDCSVTTDILGNIEFEAIWE